MLAALLGELVVLYDLQREVVHVLNASAGLVWLACDGSTDLAEAVVQIVEATAGPRAQVARDVAAGVDQLAAAGLVGRADPAPVPVPVERSPVDGPEHSAVHAVLDDGVRFVGEDPRLLEAIDALMGGGGDRAPTIDLGVQGLDDGTVRVHGWGPTRTYGSPQAFLDAVPSALNQIAAASSSCLALHSGAVRSRTGAVVLLPAASGAGKTTLTAALVQAGWAYATDEAVGVRAGSLTAVAYPKPLVLDLQSQDLLGMPPTGTINVLPTMLRPDAAVLRGDIGAVHRVVLPRFEPGAALALTTLGPRDALIGVLEHTLNLARVGQPGLAALCQLAMEVPVHRLVHGAVRDAVRAVEDLAGR